MQATDFDPNAPADPSAGLFGLDCGPDAAGVHVIPVPFDATTSYRPGAAAGPEAVLRASHQVDLHCPLFGSTWEAGICMLPTERRITELERQAFLPARRVIEAGGRLGGDAGLEADLELVNAAGAELNQLVEAATANVLAAGRLPVVLGGDHSVPFGAIAACAKAHPGLGILHIDAHADLRNAYEGFTWSHASILHGALTRLEGIQRVVQMGVRDLCDDELAMIRLSDGRIATLFDEEWSSARLGGRLPSLVRESLEKLPSHVYLTVDIDGLDPALCPNTGTPVPGGFQWGELSLILKSLAESGRRVVGMDLVEISPGPEGLDSQDDSWDANVGARLLYRMVGAALATRG